MKQFKEELINTMIWLGQKPDAIFLGQGIKYPGHCMYETLIGVPENKKIEFPVAEELQLGVCIGLSLLNLSPLCLFPRVNFLFRAADQLINHLDKIELISSRQFKPFVIIRTMNGSTDPLDPGPQHKGDYTDALRAATSSVMVIKLREPEHILKSYKWAY